MTCDVEMHGKTLREGDRAFLLIGSANRDPRVFSNPDAFDIDRDTSEMLSFGRGVHFCLGASLARLEGRVGLEEFISAVPKFEIDMDNLVRVHSINVRGFASMPVRIG
jgi:cytochrome P450